MSGTVEAVAIQAASKIDGDPPQFGSWVAILLEVALPLVQGCLDKRSEGEVASDVEELGVLAKWVIRRRVRSVVREFDLPRSEVRPTENKLYEAIVSTCEGCDAKKIVHEINSDVPDVNYIDMF